MINRQALTEIKQHALDYYPNECCGFISKGQYIPLENYHSHPENNFLIDHMDYLKHEGEIDFIVHSHVNGKKCPSAQDMKSQMSSGVPWAIVVTDGVTVSEPVFFGDELDPAPLEGREYISGVYDCLGLARDYQRLHGKYMPNEPRDDNWDDYADLFHIYLEKHSDIIYPIPQCELKPGDLLLMRIRGEFLNHVGTYLGDELILHHLRNRVSCKEPVSRYFKFTKMFVRVK